MRYRVMRFCVYPRRSKEWQRQTYFFAANVDVTALTSFSVTVIDPCQSPHRTRPRRTGGAGPKDFFGSKRALADFRYLR